MPIYDYYCPYCDYHVEILHPMIECDEPSEETQMETSCNENTCPVLKNSEANREEAPEMEGLELGRPFKRGITAPNLNGFVGGESVGEKGVLAKKQQEKKLRSRKHFKKEVLPDLEPGADKQHFEKKYKDLNVKGKLK